MSGRTRHMLALTTHSAVFACAQRLADAERMWSPWLGDVPSARFAPTPGTPQLVRGMAPLRNLSEWLSPEPARRLARLRPEYASLYPEIPPATWVTAFSAAVVVVGGVFGGARTWPGTGTRVLVDEHFVFRGGGARAVGWTGLGSRHDDP